ncbi:iron-sulfur cluster repair di-iron protein [Staphylospora marina]|uniref:iron-sulfur cluster repair di-iron protein n=1 Tax=Staphylospora marina TaxID=2490858 RepID=UPI000F5BFC40|nr:iron-sulfur cluster repair di-iron protein [Staphylospora marina]
MTRKFNGEEKIGEIVTIFPSASNLFMEYRIDFCCGGNRILKTALSRQKIDEEEFLAKLNEAYLKEQKRSDQAIDWRKKSFSALIDHIVRTHHEYLNNELPVLSAFVTKVFDRHGMDHPELAELHRLFHELKEELEQHLPKEEQEIFPFLKEYEKTGSKEALEKAAQAIEQLEAEHNKAGELLRNMRKVTNHYQLPKGACRTYALSYIKLEQLESDLFQHIHLENNVMFPRVMAGK